MGLETAGGVVIKLIERSTAILTEKAQTFMTYADNRLGAPIQVFDGELAFTVSRPRLAAFRKSRRPTTLMQTAS